MRVPDDPTRTGVFFTDISPHFTLTLISRSRRGFTKWSIHHPDGQTFLTRLHQARRTHAR
jgi:hypothetical protein